MIKDQELEPQMPGQLQQDRVHLWWVNPISLEEAGINGVLSSSEMQRRDRYRCMDNRRRFAVSRSCLRIILGRYLETPPAEVNLVEDDCGKPGLAQPEGSIHFNISHSGERTLLLFSTAGPVGVDIEEISDIPDIEAIAPTFCSAEELAGIHILNNPERRHALFQLWTAKEAFSKAMGKGLGIPLQKISIRRSDHGRSIYRQGDGRENSGTMELLAFAANTMRGYRASVALPSGILPNGLLLRRFPDGRPIKLVPGAGLEGRGGDGPFPVVRP